jgi:uncharacterized protein (TIGR02466 family)
MLNLFGTPVYLNNIKIKDKDINNLIDSNYERLKSNIASVTTNTFILDNKENINIKNIILDNLNKYLYNQLKIKKHVKFRMLNSWCMKLNKNDWAVNHTHDNSFISGVLYLKTYKNSGNLILHRNKLLNIFPSSVKIEFEKINEINCEYYSITPEEGDIIFFPSQLEHSVTKNLNEKDRYCCAFNFYPEGNFGQNSDLNVLKI